MPPKRKAVSKSKTAVAAAIPEDDVIEILQPTGKVEVEGKNTEERGIEDEKLPMSDKKVNMSTTVVLEKMPDLVSQTSEKYEDEPEAKVKPNKKPVQKKAAKVLKSKSKSKLEDDSNKKSNVKRAVSEEPQVIVEKDSAVSKSRKRPINKESPEPISPVNELPKRGRRAASVDIQSSDNNILIIEDDHSEVIKKGRKATKLTSPSDDDAPKKSHKVIKKDEQPKVTDKNTKSKKNSKKVIEEKENLQNMEQNVFDKSPDTSSKKPKPKTKRGAKKEQKNKPVEEVQDEEESDPELIPKPTNKRGAPKARQIKDKDSKVKSKRGAPQSKVCITLETSEESNCDEKQESDDSLVLTIVTPELKPKRRAPKSKVNKLSEKPGGSNEGNVEIIDSDSTNITTPELKPKRGARKEKKNNVEEKEKQVKRGRKVKGGDFEEVKQKTPPAGDEEVQIVGMADGLSDTPESEKSGIKNVVARRKPRAKISKK